MPRHRKGRRAASKSWDAVAAWYTGWSGAEGSRHHRLIAIPALLDLLQPQPGEHILDIGCGPGALAPHIARTGACYDGIDASARLIGFARRHHSANGRFIVGDATRLDAIGGLAPASFDAASFLLSIQDINPLEDALKSAAFALKAGGRLVIVMTHPCFRVPRQSGWGWDEKRRLRFRRVDRYLTRLDVPMQPYGGRRAGTTRSYHRPLGAYFEGLSSAGFVIDAVREIAADPLSPKGRETSAEVIARREFPLFLAIRARRC